PGAWRRTWETRGRRSCAATIDPQGSVTNQLCLRHRPHKISPKELRPRERTMGLQWSPQIWRSRIHFVVLALASTLRSFYVGSSRATAGAASSNFLRGESGRWDFLPAHHHIFDQQIFASRPLPADLCQQIFASRSLPADLWLYDHLAALSVKAVD